jgi:hypothetical protein
MALDKSQELNRRIPHNTHQDDEEKEFSAWTSAPFSMCP